MLSDKAAGNRKVNNDTIIGLLCLFFLVLMTSLVAAVMIIPKTLAAEVTMEVYQQSDGKAFGKETQINIFDNDELSYLNGQKLIAPYSAGSYTFAVANTAASDVLPYTLKLTSENPDSVPIVISLEKNGEYIYGGADESQMLSLTQLDYKDLRLDGNKTDLYTLHWRWKTESDEADTALGVRAAQGEELTYTLTIIATGTIDEASLPNNGNNNIINWLPKTGDGTSILPWIVVALGAILLIILLIYKKCRKKDEKE